MNEKAHLLRQCSVRRSDCIDFRKRHRIYVTNIKKKTCDASFQKEHI